MRKKIILTAIMILLAFLMTTGLSYAKETPSVDEIWKKLMTINPGLQDYSADIKITAHAKYMIISKTFNVEGTYYFKKPDKSKLVIKKGPNFIKRYPNIFGWGMPQLEKHTASVQSGKLGNKPCYIITLIPKSTTTPIAKEMIWIDASNYTFPMHVYNYKKGGMISVRVDYRKVNNFWLFDNINAEFDFPEENLKASADGTYGVYSINPGIPDSFFDKK